MTRRIELARAFANRQGWTISDEHVFVDDGVSAGIFDPKKRPASAPCWEQPARCRATSTR